jgi:hypothetical protein
MMKSVITQIVRFITRFILFIYYKGYLKNRARKTVTPNLTDLFHNKKCSYSKSLSFCIFLFDYLKEIEIDIEYEGIFITIEKSIKRIAHFVVVLNLAISLRDTGNNWLDLTT